MSTQSAVREEELLVLHTSNACIAGARRIPQPPVWERKTHSEASIAESLGLGCMPGGKSCTTDSVGTVFVPFFPRFLFFTVSYIDLAHSTLMVNASSEGQECQRKGGQGDNHSSHRMK